MISYEWRGPFEDAEVSALHAEGFDHALSVDTWREQVVEHSLGWVCAREDARLVAVATDNARAAGCAWLHVDFEDHLRAFYFDSCGFIPTNAGLIAL